MKSPQTANGFTAIANELYEQYLLFPFTKIGEMKVLLYILRKTYGFKKQEDRISLSQFAKGTGLSERYIQRVIPHLIEHNMIWREMRPNPAGNPRAWFGIQKDYSCWIEKPDEEFWIPLSVGVKENEPFVPDPDDTLYDNPDRIASETVTPTPTLATPKAIDEKAQMERISRSDEAGMAMTARLWDKQQEQSKQPEVPKYEPMDIEFMLKIAGNYTNEQIRDVEKQFNLDRGVPLAEIERVHRWEIEQEAENAKQLAKRLQERALARSGDHVGINR